MMPVAGGEKVETPFGIYDPLEAMANEADMARFLNDTSPDSIVEFATPDDIVRAITPMAKHTPQVVGEENQRVILSLFNSSLTISAFDENWSIDSPADKLLAEVVVDEIKIPSLELLNKLNQECYESSILIKQNNTLMFRRMISLENGVTQLNLLSQLNGFIRESSQIIEQIIHGEHTLKR